jgi:hypothetical protein
MGSSKDLKFERALSIAVTDRSGMNEIAQTMNFPKSSASSFPGQRKSCNSKRVWKRETASSTIFTDTSSIGRTSFGLPAGPTLQ